MKNRICILAVLLIAFLLAGCAQNEVQYKWAVHDPNRPTPRIITPGNPSTQPPSDAIVLFDGTGLSEWADAKTGGPTKWRIKGDAMLPVKDAGYIMTKRHFGSCQLHIEWVTPEKVTGTGQGRGNSGVFLMGKYEVQILDSYNNETYADGQAAAIYGQKPPIVNTCRAPGKWQSYDIIFHAPEFDGDEIVKPATITVFQNGVLVQDHWQIKGNTWHKRRSAYEPHAGKLPLRLQDHGNPVKFRNVWIREL